MTLIDYKQYIPVSHLTSYNRKQSGLACIKHLIKPIIIYCPQ